MEMGADLLEETGLALNGWTIKADNPKRRTGVCNYSTRVIGIARRQIEFGTEDALLNTLTHEVAHALVGPDADHGPEWQAAHRSLGGNGERCSEVLTDAPKGKYEAVCVECNVREVAWRWRLSDSMRSAVHTVCRSQVVWRDADGIVC